ncbi:MAG TPA: O-antigen ligase family protein [Nitrospira sp.]|nr:O-antigen ligase family protein [Nitrospira sp.]
MMHAEVSPRTARVLPWARQYLPAFISYLLMGYVAVLPFTPLLVLERNGFLLLLGLLVLWCVSNRKLFFTRTPYDVMLFSFVLWIGLTLPFSISPLYSLKEYGKLLQQVAIFYAVIYFLREDRYRRALFYIVGAAAIVVAAYGLTQFNLANPQAVKSFLPAEVWLTTFLVMVFPFAFALVFGSGPLEAKWTAIVACCLFVGCLLITQSRAGLVAFIAELCLMAWLLRSLKAKIVAGVVTLCLLMAVVLAIKVDFSKERDPMREARAALPVQTSLSSIVHRLDIWAFTMSEIVKHGLVGIGYGSHSYLLTYGEEKEVVTEGHAAVKRAGTHNIFLYLALHVGLPGVVLFGWLYYTLVLRTVREYRTATHWMQQGILAGSAGSLVGLLCRLQFDQMLVGSLAVFFWVLLAIAVLQYPSLKAEAKSSLA